jgi:hypothetical protein
MRATATLAVLAIAAPAHADELGYHMTRGTLQPGVQHGSFVLTTDAAPGRFSDSELIFDREVSLPYRLDVSWRRLGPEAGRSLHVVVAGGVVLIKTGKVALYAYDEVKFSADGWTSVPALVTHREQAIAVVQDRHRVVVSLDGKEIASFAHEVPATRSFVGIGMKGATGYRSGVYVRSLAVRSQ